MADAQLHFKLGSSADTRGFEAMSREVERAGKEGKKLSGALGNVLSEAQKLDGALGNTAKMASNVVNGFAQMGIIGGIVAGAKTAMDLFFDSAKEGYDKMAKAAQDNADRQQKALQKAVDAHIKGVHDANEATRKMGAEAVKQFDETAAAAVKASQLIAQTDIARANNSIAKVQVEKLNAIIKEETDEGRAVVAAKYDLKIAELKAAQAEELSTEKSKEASKAVETARGRVAQTQNQLNLAEQALAKAKDEESKLSHVRMADTKKIKEEVAQAERAYKEAQRNHTQSVNGLANEEEKLKAVEINVSTERTNQEAAILQAKIALEKANEAEEKAAKARLKEAEEAEKAAKKLAAKNAARDMEAALAERTGFSEELAGQLAADVKKLREEVEDINKDMVRVREGVETDARVKNGTFGTYHYRLDANGNPDNFIDWRRAVRFAERAERDRATREKRDSQFQKKMQDLQDRLDKRGEKALTEREKDALKRWNEYQNQKTGRERREAEIKQKQEKIEFLRKQIAQDVKETKEMIQQSLELQ